MIWMINKRIKNDQQEYQINNDQQEDQGNQGSIPI